MAFRAIGDTFFRFESVGSYVDGWYMGTEIIKDSEYIRLLTEDGRNLLVIVHTVLRWRFKSVDFGDYVRIVYEGERKTEGRRRPIKVYTVLIDDERKMVLSTEERARLRPVSGEDPLQAKRKQQQQQQSNNDEDLL